MSIVIVVFKTEVCETIAVIKSIF